MGILTVSRDLAVLGCRVPLGLVELVTGGRLCGVEVNVCSCACPSSHGGKNFIVRPNIRSGSTAKIMSTAMMAHQKSVGVGQEQHLAAVFSPHPHI